MRVYQWISARASKVIGLALALIVSAALFAFADAGGSRVAAQAPAKIEATIFSYDGQDFVRTKTTLLTEDGKSAVNTKLDHATPAYKALVQKRSYTGDATVFGKKYEASYAPLTGKDGHLTGALFVAVAK
jgi:cytochrome bd-type quinol oxidase subunit 1